MNKLNLHIIINNNRIYHKYFIEKTFESGIVLLGWEVKSIRSKSINIDNSYVSFQNDEAYIYNAFFHTSSIHNELAYDPIRKRKLLLKKKELLFLKNKINQNNYTIIILNFFKKDNWIKTKIGLAKGKKKYDKRYIINTNLWKKEKTRFTNRIL